MNLYLHSISCTNLWVIGCDKWQALSMDAVGSKWTARETTLGWRHFSVIDRKSTDIGTYALMEATCETDVRIWVSHLFILATLRNGRSTA